ncbi:MAG: Txe/YoeB family addiction module toxin [Alphaproteobacteria bacterium]|nr:Txe/YoeB family addiction module toxin [Alphaproteobacteria bacterium]
MNICFTPEAFEDYLYWQTQDKKTLKRIHELLKSIQRDSYGGIGKPERLRWDLNGCWSRRIDQEHRLVYRIEGNSIHILACRFHYE